MSQIRRAARRAERFLFWLLDSIFNGGEAFRAAERNDTNRSRERARQRLDRLRELRRQRLRASAIPSFGSKAAL